MRWMVASFGTVPPHQQNGPNASDYGAPKTSAYVEGIREAIAAGRVVRRVAPISTQRTGGYRAKLGAVVARPMQVRAVIQSQFGYAGILPLDQQPKINKPQPYAAVRRP